MYWSHGGSFGGGGIWGSGGSQSYYSSVTSVGGFDGILPDDGNHPNTNALDKTTNSHVFKGYKYPRRYGPKTFAVV